MSLRRYPLALRSHDQHPPGHAIRHELNLVLLVATKKLWRPALGVKVN